MSDGGGQQGGSRRGVRVNVYAVIIGYIRLRVYRAGLQGGLRHIIIMIPFLRLKGILFKPLIGWAPDQWGNWEKLTYANWKRNFAGGAIPQQFDHHIDQYAGYSSLTWGS